MHPDELPAPGTDAYVEAAMDARTAHQVRTLLACTISPTFVTAAEAEAVLALDHVDWHSLIVQLAGTGAGAADAAGGGCEGVGVQG